jgi:flagellar basal-body rod modification protein FlgD
MATTPSLPATNTAETLTSTQENKPGTQRQASSSLGKDDFLKLLVGQMKNMDPLGAGSNDPSQSMAQMTQYSILEQLTNLSKANEDLAAQTKTSSTIALIGKTVTYSQADGTPASGKVEQVTTVDGKLSLTVDGKAGVDPDTVIEVR